MEKEIATSAMNGNLSKNLQLVENLSDGNKGVRVQAYASKGFGGTFKMCTTIYRGRFEE